MTNLFYKLPADILQAECIQKMLKEPGALAQFGLTMLLWITIQDSRDKKVSSRALKNTFAGISSEGQRKKALNSGFFDFDAKTDTYSLNSSSLHTGAHSAAHPTAHTPVPILKELDKDIEKEVEENTRETTTPTTISFSSLILELKYMTPTQGELWEGVLLYCPDQSLRTVMTEHWDMTVDFIEKHLRASGMIAQVKDMKSLCDAMRDLFQPSNPAFGGLKLFLEQEAKPDIEKAFDQWIAKQSNILLMQEPLSFQQFCDLVKMGFDARTVRYTVERLNNYPSTPRKYVSAFHTVRDWLRNPNYK